jgi:hypothetical protein
VGWGPKFSVPLFKMFAAAGKYFVGETIEIFKFGDRRKTARISLVKKLIKEI